MLRLSFSVCRDFSLNFDRKLSVMYKRWLPLSNNKRIFIDLVPSSFVAIAVAVCNKTLGFEFVFSELVVAVVTPLFSVFFSFCYPDVEEGGPFLSRGELVFTSRVDDVFHRSYGICLS